MPTHYVMKEMPDLQGKGERVTYPQMVLLGQSSTRELAEYISLRSGFSPGMVEGIICELAEAMAHTMARGFSAKIDGIGTFTPGLVIGADKEREEADGDATHRNAQSIFVGKINFQAEKELVYKTKLYAAACTVEACPLFAKIYCRTTVGDSTKTFGSTSFSHRPYVLPTDGSASFVRNRRAA